MGAAADGLADGHEGRGAPSRREFLRCAMAGGAGCVLGAGWPGAVRAAGAADVIATDDPWFREARFWESLPGGRARCLLCPNLCERGEGEVSRCHSRIVRGGRFQTMTYGNLCLINEDSLAKNPLFHVQPGASAIGVAAAGCNLVCRYCQNWDVSQVGPRETKILRLSPGELVAKATQRGLKWLTFSYTEPVVYFEYAVDAARLARQKGLKVAVVTAAHIRPDPLAELARHADAFSVTLKGHTESFYREICGGSLEDVRRSLGALVRLGKWVEVVNLVVPGLNDTTEAFEAVAAEVLRLGRGVPLHFLRFAPAFKLRNLPPTPVSSLDRAHAAAVKAGLKFVYVDLPGHAAANTTCPNCGQVVIERAGFAVLQNRLKGARCPKCSYHLPGLW
jgi:pyruvate formate lyase activating enzyme